MHRTCAQSVGINNIRHASFHEFYNHAHNARLFTLAGICVSRHGGKHSGSMGHWLIQSTDNSNPRLLEPHAYSNQNRFPLVFPHTFTVIVPSVTRTLANSILPLTRSNFCFLTDHFYEMLPSITQTMFWALKKERKNSDNKNNRVAQSWVKIIQD